MIFACCKMGRGRAAIVCLTKKIRHLLASFQAVRRAFIGKREAILCWFSVHKSVRRGRGLEGRAGVPSSD